MPGEREARDVGETIRKQLSQQYRSCIPGSTEGGVDLLLRMGLMLVRLDP
jgi:hypothetical protein